LPGWIYTISRDMTPSLRNGGCYRVATELLQSGRRDWTQLSISNSDLAPVSTFG